MLTKTVPNYKSNKETEKVSNNEAETIYPKSIQKLLFILKKSSKFANKYLLN